MARSVAAVRSALAKTACLAWLVLLGVPGVANAKVDLLELPSLIVPKAASALMLDIAVRGNHVIAVGDHGVILHHVTGQKAPAGAVQDTTGVWWKQAQVPVSVNLTAVAFASGTRVFAVGHDGVVLRSNDTGATWQKVFDGNASNQQMLAMAQNSLNAFELQAASQRQALVNKPTPEGRQRLQKLEDELEEKRFAFEDAQAGARFGPARPMLDVWFKDDMAGWVVGSYGQIFQTTDGGNTFALIASRLNNPDFRHYNGLYGDQTGLLIITGEAGRVYVSEDFAGSWRRYDTGYTGQLYGAAVLRDAQGKKTLVVYGFAGTLLRLDSGSDTWRKVQTPTDKSIVDSLTLIDGLLFIDQNARLLKTDEVGNNVRFVSKVEGKLTTGISFANNHLYLSAQGGPRQLQFPSFSKKTASQP
ncbi:MAG: hypothetical protein HC848_05115 [Limnobacter sp.]|nr:hypothetical protein [Limnobacter sp.]